MNTLEHPRAGSVLSTSSTFINLINFYQPHQLLSTSSTFINLINFYQPYKLLSTSSTFINPPFRSTAAE
ncbi:MAG: hypothetical protein ABIQ93_15895 [Saprospiraceae bacterium]